MIPIPIPIHLPVGIFIDGEFLGQRIGQKNSIPY